MKKTRKSQPAAGKRAPGRPAKVDAVERQVIGARLAPQLYERLVDAAAVSGRSISAEVEHRIERSFEPSPTNPDSEHNLWPRVMAAFEAGGRLGIDPDLPVREWLKDPLQYERATLRAFEALLDAHPQPQYGRLVRVINYTRSRLDDAWLTDPARRQGLFPIPATVDDLELPPTPTEKDES